MASLQDRGLCFTSSHFSTYERNLSGVDDSASLSLSPQGLVDVDPGWMHRLESALHLFVCQCPLHWPPAGYMSGPDRLPDSGIYLGEQGKGHRGYSSHRLRQTLCFSFLYHWSCFPFMMTGTRGYMLPATTVPITLVLKGHSTIKPYYHIPGKWQTRKEARESTTVRALLQLRSKFFWTPIMWRATHRIQIIISHAIFSVYSWAACNI